MSEKINYTDKASKLYSDILKEIYSDQPDKDRLANLVMEYGSYRFKDAVSICKSLV